MPQETKGKPFFFVELKKSSNLRLFFPNQARQQSETSHPRKALHILLLWNTAHVRSRCHLKIYSLDIISCTSSSIGIFPFFYFFLSRLKATNNSPKKCDKKSFATIYFLQQTLYIRRYGCLMCYDGKRWILFECMNICTLI